MKIAVAMISVAGLHAHAGADPFFEADLGLVAPIADDDYETRVDESVKLGIRLGSRSGDRAFDVGVDATPYNDDLDNAITDVDVERYRFTFGARWEKPLGPKAHLFVRGAAGIDLIHYTATGTVFGVDFEFSETDVGIALEVSSGVLFDVGPVEIGAKLGIPFAFHFEEDDPNDQEDADLDYVGVDLDVAFVLAARF